MKLNEPTSSNKYRHGPQIIEELFLLHVFNVLQTKRTIKHKKPTMNEKAAIAKPITSSKSAPIALVTFNSRC